VVFPHGQEILNNALLAGQAISYLFIRKDKGGMFTLLRNGLNPNRHREEEWSTRLDLNADHIAVSRIDASGNPTEAWSIATLLFGKSKHQIEAMLGDAVASAVRMPKTLDSDIIENSILIRKNQTEQETNRRSR